MKTTTIARIGAAGFVVTALALSIVQLNEPASTTTQTVFVADDKIDTLPAELRRCRSIGQAAASDTPCLRAWAEQRSRCFMGVQQARSAEHTSELQSLMRNSYALYCLKHKKSPVSSLQKKLHKYK